MGLGAVSLWPLVLEHWEPRLVLVAGGARFASFLESGAGRLFRLGPGWFGLGGARTSRAVSRLVGKRVSRWGSVPLRRCGFRKDVSQRECARRSHDNVWRSLRRAEPAVQYCHARTVVERKSCSWPNSGLAHSIELPIFKSGGDRESTVGHSSESTVCDKPARLRRPTSGAARIYARPNISFTGGVRQRVAAFWRSRLFQRTKLCEPTPGAERLAQLWPAAAGSAQFFSTKWTDVPRLLAKFP
jgi:hypothetical protein